MSPFNTQKNPPWARQNDCKYNHDNDTFCLCPSYAYADFNLNVVLVNNVQQPAMQTMMSPSVMQFPQGNAQQNVYSAQIAMQQQALSMQQFVASNAAQVYTHIICYLTI